MALNKKRPSTLVRWSFCAIFPLASLRPPWAVSFRLSFATDRQIHPWHARWMPLGAAPDGTCARLRHTTVSPLRRPQNPNPDGTPYMKLRKIVILALIAAAVAAFFAFDLGQYLSLGYLKQSQATFAGLYERQPLAVAAVYFVIYVAVTALSVPGAAILTLAGGRDFRLGLGHADRVVCLQPGGHAGVSGGAVCAAGQHRGAVWPAPGRDQQRHQERRRVLSVHIAAGAAGAVFCDQSGDGPDADARHHVLLGQPAGHAGGHRGVRERGHAAGTHRVTAGHFEPGADRLVCAAGRVSADRAQGGRGRAAAQGVRALGRRAPENL